METVGGIVLILGSGPNAATASDWPSHPFDALIAVNNAWRVRRDWTHHIHPEDFPAGRRPDGLHSSQRVVTYEEYVPCQNLHGGVVYAGGTMAFTTGYWALARLRPRVMAFLGCDMVYPAFGATHFYGTGAADPLREDPTLRSLEAKAARLFLLAEREGCRCVNLSTDSSRLVFPRATLEDLSVLAGADGKKRAQGIEKALEIERQCGFFVRSGRYWESSETFDHIRIDAIDRLWLDAFDSQTEVSQF